MKGATYAVAKRNPEKIQAYQTLRTLTSQTLVRGSNPGKPEFFQPCVKLSNTSKLTWTRKSLESLNN